MYESKAFAGPSSCPSIESSLAKIKEPKIMRVKFQFQVNLGNFNLATLGAELSDEIEDIENFDTHFDFLYKKIRKKIYSELAKLNSSFNKVKEDMNEKNR